jgi:hypothetical protein
LDWFTFNPRWRIGIAKHELHLLEGRASFGARLFSLRLAVREHAGVVDGSLIPLIVVFAAPPLLGGYLCA